MNSKIEKMPVIGHITKGIHTWAGKIAVACFVLVLASAGYAADQVVGNFETGLDGWTEQGGGTSDLGNSAIGATMGSQSMTVLAGPGDEYYKLQHDGLLNLIGATSIAMDVTLIASEWPSDASLSINKIALMDHTFWAWQETSGITVAKISGADPPAPDGSGNITWTPSMGDATWTISWSLAGIGKSNDVYGFYISLVQLNVAKTSAGLFYIDNIRVRYGAAETTTVVIGNWEGASLDGWVPGWNGSPVLTPGSTSGVTLGSGSLCVQWTGAGWDWVLQWSAPTIPALRPGTLLKFDLTAFGSDFTNWAKVADAIAINSNGTSGWKQYSTTTATNRNTGAPEGLDFGSWSGTVERTYSLDISDYDATGATWFQIIISMQVDAGNGKVYLDNARLTYPVISVPERLHVERNKIKNSDGSVVVLRGVSLIDLGSLQDWEGGAVNMINRLTDENDANCDSTGWHTKIIRIPVFPPDGHDWPYEFNPNDLNDPANETLYNLLRSVVDRCAEKGVYAVIDWHGLVNTYDLVDQTSAFWTYMAPRFADDTHVIFELFNEPINDIGTDAENWASVKADMQTWIDIVRSYAPHTLLFVGTPRWCQIIGPTVDNPVDDPNVVYVSHIYPWHWLNANQYYRESITAAAAAHPVIMGEWGFIDDISYGATTFGTSSNYGEPLKDFVEGLSIGNIAWVASYDWGPPMFDYDSGSGVWTLLSGDGGMGCFVKDWLYEKRNVEWSSELTINRCKVTAGKTQGLDAFEASGTFTVVPPNLLDVTKMNVDIISLADGNTIYSEDCNLAWDLQNNRFIWSCKIPKGGGGRITLLMLDFRGKTVVIKASNINLTGLGCPLRLNITLGDYVLSGDINEAVVNGSSPIPIRLMRTYKDTLAVTKASVSNSSKPLKDSFSAKGSITVQDINGPNAVDSAFVITWSDQNETSVQTFTIPAHSFKAAKKGHSYKCKNIRAAEVGGGIVNATIDMDKCTFTLSVKNTNLSVTSGNVKLGLSFAAFDETANYSLPRRR